MADISTLIARHGYMLVGLIVFAESIGLPVPAALALIAGGAAASSGTLRLAAVLAISVLVMLLGDTLLFLAGRHTGWALLGLLCRTSLNPETCILRSAESFYKRGKTTLLFAKFVPGINTMAPPLAGSMKMPLPQFLKLDAGGSLLYVGAYCLGGFLFRDFIYSVTDRVQMAKHAIEMVLLGGLVLFVGYRIWAFRKYSRPGIAPRVPVTEVARRLQAEGEGDVIVADVRSHGYYNADSDRIKGSIRLEPNNLAEELKALPRDKDIFLYCT